jgi:hypothetical protein
MKEIQNSSNRRGDLYGRRFPCDRPITCKYLISMKPGQGQAQPLRILPYDLTITKFWETLMPTTDRKLRIFLCYTPPDEF